MKQIIFAAFLLSLMLGSQMADANPRHYNISKKQYNQKQRIHAGVKSGQLTRPETRQLRMQQMRVKHYKQMAMADGRVSPHERQMIRQQQMKANHSIYRQKHDGQRRYGYKR